MYYYSDMREALERGNAPRVKALAEHALEEGRSATEILNEGLIAAMSVVGVKFKNNEIYVPEVMVAARAMTAGLNVIRPILVETGAPSEGKVVIGTVKGDLHDIGKNLVGMMAEGAGFTVVDLGTDTSAEKFVAAAKEHDARIVGMSALLTTTMIYMRTVVQKFQEADMRHVKLCIGGAPATVEYARQIGADGYAADAASAVDLFRRLAAEPGTAPA